MYRKVKPGVNLADKLEAEKLMIVRRKNGKSFMRRKRPAVKHTVCSLWFCDHKHYGKGYCAVHLQNFHRGGSPLPKGAKSLRQALLALKRMRILSLQLAYAIDQKENSITCRACGSIQALDAEMLHHEEGCYVAELDTLIALTTDLPNKDAIDYLAGEEIKPKVEPLLFSDNAMDEDEEEIVTTKE